MIHALCNEAMNPLYEAEHPQQAQPTLGFTAEDWTKFYNEPSTAPTVINFGLEPMDGSVPKSAASDLDPGAGFPFYDRAEQKIFDSVPIEFDLLEPDFLKPDLPEPDLFDAGRFEFGRFQPEFCGNSLIRPDIVGTGFSKPELLWRSYFEPECLDFEGTAAQGVISSSGKPSASQEIPFGFEGADDHLYEHCAPIPNADQPCRFNFPSSVAFGGLREWYPGELEPQFPQIDRAEVDLEIKTLDTSPSQQPLALDNNLTSARTPQFVDQCNESPSKLVPEYLASTQSSHDGAIFPKTQNSRQSKISMPNTINAITNEPVTLPLSPITKGLQARICDVQTMPRSNISRQILKEPTSLIGRC